MKSPDPTTPDIMPPDPVAPDLMTRDRSTQNNVGDWPARWAARLGSRLAVTDEDRALTWQDFERRIAGLTGWLSAAGIRPGDRIGILLANRVAYLELVFASARLGAICLPINLRLSPREIAFILDDAAPAALFYESERHTAVVAAVDQASHTPKISLSLGEGSEGNGRYEEEIVTSAPQRACAPVHADDPMMLMYTSGTTGVPKGALLPHRKVLYNSLNAQLFFGIRSDDRVLVVAPLFHSLGLQILSLPLLYCGGSLVLERRFDPERVWDTVRSQKITYFGGVPAMHQRLDDVLPSAPGSAFDAPSLRFVFTAGSAVSVELVRSFDARGIVLKQGYGQTETSILCCLDARDALRKAGSVGLPVFHVELRVVKREGRELSPSQWRDAALGETGEIVVRGPITMLGYWRRPAETAETLIEGWLCTGDLATRDEQGFITLVGRARDMIISGGENVYPAEVEAVFREHPAIREIAVVGEPDARWGEVGRAHIVLSGEHRLDVLELEEWARERLASFKIPRHFVVEQELPHTASGKIQKHRLGERR